MRIQKTTNAGAGKWSRPSLAVLLTAWYTTASFLVVAVSTGSLYFGLANNLRIISQQSLLDEVDVCHALLLEKGIDALHEEVEIDSAVRRYQRFYIRVVDENGKASSTTRGMDEELSSTRITEAAANHHGVFMVESPANVPYLAILATLPTDKSGNVTNLQMAVDLTQEREILSRQRVWVWTVLATALILCPGVGFAIARRGTRPLREVAETARHISSSTLSERIRAEGYPMEVRVLAEAFNSMLERLEESFERLFRFSADIAHELRNPVNNIRGEAEVALARARTPEEYVEVLGSCLEESVRLTELIESLLFLARSESPGDHLRRTREDLGRLLMDLRDYYEASATELGLTLNADVVDDVVGDVDRTLLQRALGNLITNALAHCSAGDVILLSVRCRDGQIRIEIRDTGSGIDAEDLPHIFDRFFRADPARSRNSGGAGLGLAIVRQIVFLHGGDVQVASEPGRGTIVSVSLPQSAPLPSSLLVS